MFTRFSKIVRKPQSLKKRTIIVSSGEIEIGKIANFTFGTTVVGSVVGGVAFMYYELTDPWMKTDLRRPKKFTELPPFTFHMTMICLIGILYGGILGALWPITTPIAIASTVSYIRQKE